ncbi:MAG: hypothetical protein ACREP9_13605 [Candidatus Dormibacteraceae bacterium]
MSGRSRTSECGVVEARSRLRAARAYLEIAELVLEEPESEEFLNVSAGLAVLAGIAASDAICCRRLKLRHRGDNHHGAAELLKEATPGQNQVANQLRQLLDLKDEAHYGVMLIAVGKARDALKWASRLVARAQEEVER